MTISWQPGVTLEQVEKDVILHALRFYDGNKTRTAAALGIAIRTLDARLEVYGLAKKENGKSLEQKSETLQIARASNLESNESDSEEPTLPMREPSEVQKLPLERAARYSAKRGR
jgi:hypothetical protein